MATHRSLMMATLALAALLGVAGCDEILPAATGGGFTDNQPLGSGLCDVPATAEAWAAEVLDLVNDERTSRGLAPLEANETLAQIAADYACEMIGGGFFDHVNPDTGSTLGTRALDGGYDYLAIGENLAGGQRSPEEVVEAWMNSPGHRANILDESFVEIGIAVRLGGDYDVYWVQEFGLPRNPVNPANTGVLPIVVHHAKSLVPELAG